MHSLMLGFSPILLHAFSTMLGYSQLDIMYIILQHIFIFISQEIGLGACFHGLPGSQARGLDAAKLLDAYSCEDRRQEKLYTAYHDFWILYSKSWNLDSRTRVIDGLFFKILEDKDQKIED